MEEIDEEGEVVNPDDEQLPDDFEENENDEILDDLVGKEEDEDNAETVEEIDPSEVTDEDIAAVMHTSSRYGDWLQQAEADGEKVDDKFAAQVARSYMGAKVLSENNIYNMRDLVAHVENLHERIDPEAVMVPREDDEKAWSEFDRDVLGIPESPQDYPSEVFEGTFMEDMDDELKSDFLKECHEQRLMTSQVDWLMDHLNTEREIHQEVQEEEAKDYKLTQRAALEKEFGDQMGEIMKDVNKFFAQYGRAFVDEHKGTPVLSSAALVKMIYNAMNDISTPTKVTFTRFTKALDALSDNKVLDLEEKLEEDKYYDARYKNHKNPKLRKAHKLAHARLRAVQENIHRRGI